MNAIVAVDENWNIGRDGGLLARLPGDLKYFREKTLGKTLVVGRKTLESFPGGKPLPGRKTVVLSRAARCGAEGCAWYRSKEEALAALAGEDVFVAGGEAIYRLFLEDCDTFYVTKIYARFEADRSFPNLDRMPGLKVAWHSGARQENGLSYEFFQYQRSGND